MGERSVNHQNTWFAYSNFTGIWKCNHSVMKWYSFTSVEDNWSIHDNANANGRQPICIIYANFIHVPLVGSFHRPMDFACNCYPHSNWPLVSMLLAHVFYANLCKFYAKKMIKLFCWCVQVLRNHVMVRVGGGWDTLAHYLEKHDPCRCRAGNPFNSIKFNWICHNYLWLRPWRRHFLLDEG